MPWVVSSNPKTLKLAGRVVLPPDEPQNVPPAQWQKCAASRMTQALMNRGIVKLCAAPKKAPIESAEMLAPSNPLDTEPVPMEEDYDDPEE